MTIQPPSALPASPPKSAPAIPQSARWIGAGLMILSGAGFSTLAILAKLAYAQGMNLAGILCLRFGGAALLLMAFLALRQPRRIYRGMRATLPLLLLGVVGYAVQASLYVGALQRIPASVCALLLYSYPAFVALLDWVIDRRHPTRREWRAMSLALAGVVLTIGPIKVVGPLDRLGVAMVLSSAIWYSGFIVTSNRLIRSAGSLVTTGWLSLGAFLTFAVVGWATGMLPTILTANQALIMVAMVVFSTILPIVTFMAGMARVGPTAASLLSTLEPVFTIGLAVIFLHESLTTPQCAGGALVLAAVVLLSLPQKA